MHVAFALMLGWSMSKLVSFKPAKVFWFVYPFVVSFVVVATANHYVFDVITGGMTALVSAFVAHYLLAPARPAVWAFGQRQATAEAPA